MKHIIYGLIDPSSPMPRVRYVGYTRRPLGRRLTDHLVTAKQRKHHRHYWIMKILDSGHRPIAIVLETVTAENWQERERWWIKHLAGNNLVNSTAGGEGQVDPTPETRAKISAGNKGKKMSPEAIERVAAANRGRVPSAEHRAKISKAHKGRKFSDETRARMSLGQKGRKHTEESLKKISEASKRHKHSPDSIEKIRIGNLGKNAGKTHTEEAKRKVSEFQKGRPKSAETKAKMAEAARRRWALRHDELSAIVAATNRRRAKGG